MQVDPVGVRFLRWMRWSGWLFILFLLVSGVAFSPYNGGHWLLWVEWFVGGVLWITARAGK